MKRKKHYCGQPGFDINVLVSQSNPIWLEKIKESRSFYFTFKGRCGLGLLCRHWDLKSDDEILVPAYNCGTEIDPFYYYGCNVRFYKINLDTTIDVEDIYRRITKKTKVVYITHYFGWPQNISALSGLCKNKNIYLVEDCALSLFSDPADHSIGTLGDAAIYSFPKTLPVPDGGALTIASNMLFAADRTHPSKKAILKEMLPLFKRMILRFTDRIGLFQWLPQPLIRSRGSVKKVSVLTPGGLSAMPQSYYYNKNIEQLTASKLTQFIVHRINAAEIKKKRRENYIRLFEAIRKSEHIKPLYQILPDGVCPLYLPILVNNSHKICHDLNERGIAAGQWWSGFHQSFSWSKFPEAKYLKENLLVLPIHQLLTTHNMDYILSQIIELAATT